MGAFVVGKGVEDELPLTSYKYIRGGLLAQKRNIYSILKWSNATPIRGYAKDRFTCLFCHKSYQKAEELKLHNFVDHKWSLAQLHDRYSPRLTIRMDITQLECTICNEKQHLLMDLLIHLKKVHKKLVEMDVKNQIIPYTFPNDEFLCAQCDIKFKYFKLLTDHLIGEHYGIHACSECGHRFINTKNLSRHRTKHEIGDYKCAYCEKQFTTRRYVLSHERLVHQLKSRVLKCRYCTERFRSSKLRNAHEVSEHGAKVEVYECHICHSHLSSELRLSEHIKMKHLKERRFFCDLCTKGFYLKSALEDHMITHTKVSEFKCEVCGKQFSRRRSLMQHKRRHVNDRRFSCDQCGASYLQKVSLRLHLRTKHGDMLCDI